MGESTMSTYTITARITGQRGKPLAGLTVRA